MYNNIASARKQLLLGGIAKAMHAEQEKVLAMPFGLAAPLTVEHVAPQNWRRHWRDDLAFGESEEDQLRLNRLVHRIGNLTLVTRALNPKLGDRPWTYKADLLRADNLEMNRRLLEDMQDATWSEQEINRRSLIIAEYVKRIWPHAARLRDELGLKPPPERSA